MKLKPIRRYEPPAYATHAELPAEEDLLEENQPRRWRLAKGLAGAISLFVAANLAGCGDTGPPWDPPPDPRLVFLEPGPIYEASEWTRSIFEKKPAPLPWIDYHSGPLLEGEFLEDNMP